MRTGPGVHAGGSEPFAVEERLLVVASEPIRVAVRPGACLDTSGPADAIDAGAADGPAAGDGAVGDEDSSEQAPAARMSSEQASRRDRVIVSFSGSRERRLAASEA